MKIELLVSAMSGDNKQSVQKGDVITAQKGGHNWGVGDLAGRFVFSVDAFLPCEVFKV